MEVTNPRRILAVSLVESAEHLSNFMKALTGTHPSPSSSCPAQPADSLAGTTHPLDLRTAYYTAQIPVWLDLVADPAEWASTFLTPEAREVLAALGGIVVVFDARNFGDNGSARELVRHVGRVVREGLGGWEWDGVSLGVGVGGAGAAPEEERVLEEMEDLCAEWGLEFVHAPLGAAAAAGEGVRNEFGEKVGIPRVREALESNNWSQATGFGDDDDDDDDPDGVDVEDAAPAARRDVSGPTSGRSQDDEDKDEDGADFDPETLDFGFDREDFAGLRQAIWSAGREGEEGDDGGEGQEKVLGEEDVEKLEGMMRKLLAVRDMSAGLPEEQRRRMARQAVGEVMKEL